MSPTPERASTSPLGLLQRNISTAVGAVVKRCWSMKRSLMWWLARPSFVASIGAACLRLTAQNVTGRPWNTSSKSHSPPKGRLLDYTPIIPATACHQSNDVETYSRYIGRTCLYKIGGSTDVEAVEIEYPSITPSLPRAHTHCT